MAQIETLLKTDLKTGVHVTPLRGTLFSQDNMGNRIVVQVTEDGEPVALTGTITGYCVLQDGQTVVANQSNAGIRNGNEGWIVLPQLAYSVVGKIDIIIKLTANGIVATIGACTGYVYKSQTDTEVVPSGTVIPDLATLEQAVANAQAATTAANTAATETSRVNIAQTKSGNVITITTTNRNGQNTSKTVTEPTAVVSKEENGPYHLTVTDANGTSKATIPDVAAEVVDKAYTDGVTAPKTALGNPIRIDDAVMAPLDKLTVKLEPKQDLHGYSKPWVGGAGKNLLPLTVAGIKALNTRGTWNGNVYTINGMTITIETDSEENVTGLVVNGTASAGTSFYLADSNVAFPAGDYIYSIPATISISNVWMSLRSPTEASIRVAVSTEVAVTVSNGIGQAYIYTNANNTFNNVRFRPMLRKASIADPSWEPYTNICPISGWDEINVHRTGKNLLVDDGHKWAMGGAYETQISATCTLLLRVKPGDTFALSKKMVMPTSDLNMTARLFDENGKFSRSESTLLTYQELSKVYTIPAGIYYIGFTQFYPAGDDKSSYQVQIERGSVITEYEAPANPFVYPISLSAAGGSVYGGNLVLNRDGSGTIQINRGYRVWDGSSRPIKGSGAPNYYYGIDEASKGGKTSTGWLTQDEINNTGLICNLFKVFATSETGSIHADAYLGNGGETLQPRIFLPDCETVDEAVAWLQAQNAAGHPVTWCYYLKENPAPIQLTAAQVKTLTGLNHISCDAGEMEIVYRADKYAEKADFLATLPRLTASGNPITLTNGADGTPLKRLSIRIDPKQAGSGTPSPSNIRPISGWDGVTVKRFGKVSDAYEEFPIPFPASIGTVYGASLVLEQDGSGTLTVDRKSIILPAATALENSTTTGSTGKCVNLGTYADARIAPEEVTTMHEAMQGVSDGLRGAAWTAYVNNNHKIYAFVPADATLEQVNSAIAGTRSVYELATPIVYHLTAPMVRTLLGYNNLISDAGTMEIEYYADPQMCIDGSSAIVITTKAIDYSNGGIMSSVDGLLPSTDYAPVFVMPDIDSVSSVDIEVHEYSTRGVYLSIEPTIKANHNPIVAFTIVFVKSGDKYKYNSTGNKYEPDTADMKHTFTFGADVSGKADKANPVFTGSISLGRKTGTQTGSESFAVGDTVEASGLNSHAEGWKTKASGQHAHAEGSSSVASGSSSHAEGGNTTASYSTSHAEGLGSTASGYASHAEGEFTIANHEAQHVFGRYNIPDPSTADPSGKGTYVEIVGNGTNTTESKRSNARTLDWNGNEKLAGGLTLGMGTTDETTISASQLKRLLDWLEEENPEVVEEPGTGGTVPDEEVGPIEPGT